MFKLVEQQRQTRPGPGWPGSGPMRALQLRQRNSADNLSADRARNEMRVRTLGHRDIILRRAATENVALAGQGTLNRPSQANAPAALVLCGQREALPRNCFEGNVDHVADEIRPAPISRCPTSVLSHQDDRLRELRLERGTRVLRLLIRAEDRALDDDDPPIDISRLDDLAREDGHLRIARIYVSIPVGRSSKNCPLARLGRSSRAATRPTAIECVGSDGLALVGVYYWRRRAD